MPIGHAADARGWIDGSPLPPSEKRSLHAFVDRFPTLLFTRDDPARFERLDVALPAWLRQVRQTLAGPAGGYGIRFDDFDFLLPISDDVGEDGFIELVYRDHFFGYTDPEQRALFLDGAGCFPVLLAVTSVQHVLGVRIGTADERIMDFCDEDIMDNRSEGRPGTDSVRPAFGSYAGMLSHIAECHRPDGSIVRAAPTS